MKSKMEIYALSVCFAAVVCIIITSGIAGYSIFKVITPDLTMSAYQYDRYQSNEAYWKSKSSCLKTENNEVKPTEDEITEKRTAEFSTQISAEKRDGLQSLIRCLMFILASGAALIIHWKLANKSQSV